jgi:protein SCO1/2
MWLCGMGASLLAPRALAAEEASRLAPFMMEDVNGTVVTDEYLQDRFTLVYFGYTHCPDICPASLNTISEVLRGLGPEAERVLPLFITVDPERDTGKLLSEYIKAFDNRLVALRGPKAYTDAAAKAFKVQYEIHPPKADDPQNYVVDHTASLILIGPDVVPIKRYPTETKAADIVADLKAEMAKQPPTPQ